MAEAAVPGLVAMGFAASAVRAALLAAGNDATAAVELLLGGAHDQRGATGVFLTPLRWLKTESWVCR